MSKLFTSLDTSTLCFSNRVVMAPLTRSRSGPSRIPNELMAKYYGQRSQSGLIISEATVISEQAIGWIDTPGIYTEEMTNGWKKITHEVHQNNGQIFLQLWHCGRASHSDFHGGNKAVAPSPISIIGDQIHTPKGKKDHEVPRELKSDEIPLLVEDYRMAAIRAKEAGFDGIEVHSANGYLLDTFLQSKTNHRSDAYGGSVEKRCRLLSEVLDAVLTVWPAENICVRLSPNGIFNDMGSDDYFKQFISVTKMIEKKSIGFLHVMDGLAFGFHEKGEAMVLEDFRSCFSGVLIGNCGYTKETAEKAVHEQKADMIAFGRPYISNPDLVQRMKKDLPLNPDASMEDWYLSSKGEKGYTDFPTHDDSK
jgi:N-ethylmaleimide reductase